ncbi:MAG: molybdate ABC transporter substrate-binding protein, partial [Candidatus Omnitrophica bacterium]|nr:molybdate ABC transporter substrate-binding protein [Candidatus Omnitrophota bacterium]
MIDRNARGSANRFLLILISAIAMLGVLGFVLFNLGRQSMPVTQGAKDENSKQSLFLYCAAGIRPPVEEVAAQYEKEYGTPIQIQYGGSNTLLSQIDVGKTGDLYIAADDNYINLAHEKGLVKEAIPLALMRPVLAVKKGNPKNIHAIEDLLRDDVKTALGNPDQAAIGKTTRKLLEDSGYWDRVQGHVTKTGVFKPTVPEVANDVKIGSVDVGV